MTYTSLPRELSVEEVEGGDRLEAGPVGKLVQMRSPRELWRTVGDPTYRLLHLPEANPDPALIEMCRWPIMPGERYDDEYPVDVVVEWLQDEHPIVYAAMLAGWRYPDGERLPLPVPPPWPIWLKYVSPPSASLMPTISPVVSSYNHGILIFV